MKITKKQVIIGVSILIVGWLIYTYVIKPKNAQKDQDTNSNSNSNTNSGGVSNIADTSQSAFGIPGNTTPHDPYKNIKRGDKGDGVVMIQKAINRVRVLKGQSKISEDGVFGGGTESALTAVIGRNNTTYAELKVKVVQVFIAAGQENPYGGGSPLEALGNLDLNPLNPVTDDGTVWDWLFGSPLHDYRG